MFSLELACSSPHSGWVQLPAVPSLSVGTPPLPHPLFAAPFATLVTCLVRPFGAAFFNYAYCGKAERAA